MHRSCVRICSVDPYPRTWAEIDLPTLGANLAKVRGVVGDGVAIALVSKADAYGHGLIPVSRYAVRNGADWIAVATVQEGIAVRDSGIDGPVLVLSPILEVEAEQAVFYSFDIVVERVSTAQALSRAATPERRARIHLKIDTGLARFGAKPSEAPEIAKQIKALPNVDLVGISQHFSASGTDPDATKQQEQRFDQAIADCKREGIEFQWIQAANSWGTVSYPSARHNLVRVGMIAYGFGEASRKIGCEPVMKWMARITAMREVLAGTPLSYGSIYVTERPSRIATVGAGYGDGYPRSASNKAHVTVCGVVVPVLGAVCMDQLLIDVTDVPNADLGEVVTLIGEKTSADDLAQAAGTITHEIVARLMSRVPRRYNFG